MIHAGKSILESLIILEFIEETWKDNPILPEDPYKRTHARFWAKFADDKFLEAMRTAFDTIGDDQAKAVESAAKDLKSLEGEIQGKFYGEEKIGLDCLLCGSHGKRGWL
ncbi:hypothetical protein HHK36_017125 [Tetracentron sinense]|uniref:Glutathione S-transferase n=1 Tax=Tetracentron sinense TaxID=13715 RepID=A0A834YYC1_TETSI|nr:hypothetical protein HHK36_017125 [Tetracentron sinense]